MYRFYVTSRYEIFLRWKISMSATSDKKIQIVCIKKYIVDKRLYCQLSIFWIDCIKLVLVFVLKKCRLFLKVKRNRMQNSSLPYVGNVSDDVILCCSIKVIFGAINWRLHTLIGLTKLPPLTVVFFRSDFSREHIPSPQIHQISKRQEDDLIKTNLFQNK